MKRVFFLAVLLTLLAGCKKDPEPETNVLKNYLINRTWKSEAMQFMTGEDTHWEIVFIDGGKYILTVIVELNTFNCTNADYTISEEEIKVTLTSVPDCDGGYYPVNGDYFVEIVDDQNMILRQGSPTGPTIQFSTAEKLR